MPRRSPNTMSIIPSTACRKAALEMHRRVVGQAMDDVREVHSDRTSKVESQKQIAWCFYYVRWLTRCDIVTNTPKFVDMENVFDRRWHTVEWVDAETVPWERQKYSVFWMRNEQPSAWTTSDPNVIDWKPSDRVRMVIRPSETLVRAPLVGRLGLRPFRGGHRQPQLARSPEGNVDGGPHLGSSAKRFRIPTPGVHEARVRLVRRTGTRGPESYVKLRARMTIAP